MQACSTNRKQRVQYFETLSTLITGLYPGDGSQWHYRLALTGDLDFKSRFWVRSERTKILDVCTCKQDDTYVHAAATHTPYLSRATTCRDQERIQT
jgi:hypothetical protein